MAEKKKEKNQAAVQLGALGGVKGGPARAKALKPARRSAIASHAACVRWRGADACKGEGKSTKKGKK